jgi:hypothetical protein
MIKHVEGTVATPQIIIVENWFEGLKRLAPPSEWAGCPQPKGDIQRLEIDGVSRIISPFLMFP